jgi:hypothetical protein
VHQNSMLTYLELGQLASVLAYLWALKRAARQAACLWLVLRHINRAAVQYCITRL